MKIIIVPMLFMERRIYYNNINMLIIIHFSRRNILIKHQYI